MSCHPVTVAEAETLHEKAATPATSIALRGLNGWASLRRRGVPRGERSDPLLFDCRHLHTVTRYRERLWPTGLQDDASGATRLTLPLSVPDNPFVTLSNRGWTREPTKRSGIGEVRLRTPRRSSGALTPGRLVLLLVVLALAVILLPRHLTINGYHVHPKFAPYLAPYLLP